MKYRVHALICVLLSISPIACGGSGDSTSSSGSGGVSRGSETTSSGGAPGTGSMSGGGAPGTGSMSGGGAPGTGSTSSGSTSTSTSTSSGSGGGGAKICPEGPFAADPLPGNKTAKKVQGGFHFLEGPVWLADEGALVFSDMDFSVQNQPPLNGPHSIIHKFKPPSTFEDFIPNGNTNGLALDGEGLLACTHDVRAVSRYDLKTKARTVIVDKYMGKRFNSPNDVAARSDGNIYFSDPTYQLSGQSELPMAFYRISPKGDVSVIEATQGPNGVTLSPDEKTLYLGAVDGKIRAYTLGADGAPMGTPKSFANTSGPDGMTVDCAGNLYVAGQAGVDVFSSAGNKLGTINGVGTATNVAFGGADRKTLYITAGDSLYSIGIAVPGYPY